MNRTRSIYAYLLILIYGILFLHDVVPHSHQYEENHDHSHNHFAHSHDHKEIAGLFAFLKGLIHSHSEVADAQHHDLVYKATTFSVPVWLFVGQAIVPNSALAVTDWSEERLPFVASEHFWYNNLLPSPKCLRAPPMS